MARNIKAKPGKGKEIAESLLDTVGAGSPIQEAISSALTQVDGARKQAGSDWVPDNVELEFTTVTSSNVNGGVDFKIVNFGGKVEEGSTHKVKVNFKKNPKGSYAMVDLNE